MCGQVGQVGTGSPGSFLLRKWRRKGEMGRGTEKQRGAGSKARGGRGEAGGEGGELASVGPRGKVSGRTRTCAGAEQPPFSSH